MKVSKLMVPVFALAFAAILSTSGVVGAQDDGAMDHAAMASSYQAEAKDDQAKAASHEVMLNRYKNMITPKGAAVPKEEMVKHCQKLVDTYKAAATQATDLAKMHQAAAAAAAK